MRDYVKYAFSTLLCRIINQTMTSIDKKKQIDVFSNPNDITNDTAVNWHLSKETYNIRIRYVKL